MAKDFIRIGGGITSAPLNENFRQLRNNISISNVNLVFSETDGIKETLEEMYLIKQPDNAQVCYVISSGELYRYSTHDNDWHKIADFGQTFRQGFLNSGAVVLEGPVKLKAGSTKILQMPNMLVYFKNKDGDERYLKGMYLINAQDIDVTSYVDTPGAYSFFINEDQNYSISTGMPNTDNPSNIYIGSFILNNQKQIEADFVYTLPDIAYTAERGHFFIDGGRASGLDLIAAGGKKVGRREGFYYDEGVNYTVGATKDFPADTDNGSNFNLKTFMAESTTESIYYIYPVDTMAHGFDKIEANELVIDKYYNETSKKLETVESGSFTIQHHLVTPAGQNILVYGTTLYNSFGDAQANLNTPATIDIDFPYAEVTRVIVGNVANFSSDNKEHCGLYTLERLTQVGTISPVFSDKIFTLYSGDAGDDIPAEVKISLQQLQAQNFNKTYTLNVKSNKETDYKFALTSKYLYGYGNEITADDKNIKPNFETRDVAENGVPGYTIPTEYYVDRLRQRIEDIETQIWASPEASKTLAQLEQDIHNQSIRFRLYDAERRMKLAETNVTNLQTKVNTLDLHKVDKDTMINGYKLGNKTNSSVSTINLTTGDITEDVGKDGKAKNLWYTEARVSANTDVANATAHIKKVGSGTKTDKNIHGLSTDDLTIGTNKFVTQNDLNKLANVPANTNSELNKKLENITIQSITNKAPTTLGQITTLAFDTFGANVTVDSANKIATIECVGQLDEDDFLKKEEYAIQSLNNPEKRGYVDKAIQADNLSAVVDGEPEQYYGTDENGKAGVYDLPKWVATEDGDDYADITQAVFQPMDRSITLNHLANSRVTYSSYNEETDLGTNVYDLVKHHYHKVYNNETQGPYLNGSTTQDTSKVYYSYTVPAGGLLGRAYYFSYNNDNYKFTANTTMVAKTVLTFTPATTTLTYKKPGDTTATVVAVTKITDINAIENDYWLSFTAQSDWNKVNEWNFGEGFEVEVIDGKAKINAKTPGTGISYFANLTDVSVEYKDTNVGKILELGKDDSGNYRIKFTDAPPLYQYMKAIDYAYDTTRVKRAVDADSADTALTADKLQNTYTVNDAGTSNKTLWTASKITANTTSQIKNEGVTTHSGTAVPTNDIGKDGDLYILLED